jgi:hypothetical protein
MVGVILGTLTCLQAVNAVRGGYDFCRRRLTKEESETKIEIKDVEPLTILAKVAFLTVLEIGTRFDRDGNTLKLQRPGLKQKVERTWLHPVDRHLLRIFNEVIIKAAVLYKPRENKLVADIFEAAVVGFENLKRTYLPYQDITFTAIEGWQAALKNSCSDNLPLPEYKFKLNELDQSYKELWSEKKIDAFLTLLKAAIDRQNQDKDSSKKISITEKIRNSKEEIDSIKAFFKIQDRDSKEITEAYERRQTASPGIVSIVKEPSTAEDLMEGFIPPNSSGKQIKIENSNL